MKAIDILQNLNVYSELLDELQTKGTKKAEQTEGFLQLTKSLSSSYSFITLSLEVRTRAGAGIKEYEERLYCEVRFEVQQGKVVFKELYHVDTLVKEQWTKEIVANTKVNNIPWQTEPKNSFYHSKEVMEYIAMADEIAAEAYNCAHGDDYRPGFFSKILIHDGLLTLEQINHMNSKSLNHKDNYSLRNLEFIIPLDGVKEGKSFQEYEIGKMKIYFRDSSSKNNRFCGEAIQKKIEEISAAFKK